MSVVLAAVVGVSVVEVFHSETWKLALTDRLLSGCSGRKFPKIGDELSVILLETA